MWRWQPSDLRLGSRGNGNIYGHKHQAPRARAPLGGCEREEAGANEKGGNRHGQVFRDVGEAAGREEALFSLECAGARRIHSF